MSHGLFIEKVMIQQVSYHMLYKIAFCSHEFSFAISAKNISIISPVIFIFVPLLLASPLQPHIFNPSAASAEISYPP